MLDMHFIRSETPPTSMLENGWLFLGDGAGVGKGRTIAGLIWENWRNVYRRY